jgi:hypothetical protein
MGVVELADGRRQTAQVRQLCAPRMSNSTLCLPVCFVFCRAGLPGGQWEKRQRACCVPGW